MNSSTAQHRTCIMISFIPSKCRSGHDGVVVDFTVILTDDSVSDTTELQGTVLQTISDASAAGTFGIPVVGGSISVSAPGRLVIYT